MYAQKFASNHSSHMSISNPFSSQDGMSSAYQLYGLNDGLAYDDFLVLPDYIDFATDDVDLQSPLTKKLKISMPLVSSTPMGTATVTKSEMAFAMALCGGINIIHHHHHNCSIDVQAMDETRKLTKKYKHANSLMRDPVVLSPKHTVRDMVGVKRSKGFTGVTITENGKFDGRLLGFVTSREIDSLDGSDMDRPLSEVMTTDLVTGTSNVSLNDTTEIIQQSKTKAEKLPIVNSSGQLVALMTRSDSKKSRDNRAASKDENNQLLVGDAIGMIREDRLKQQQQQQQQQQVDERVFHNLILRERRCEENRNNITGKSGPNSPILCGQLRHSLLSWMLRICEHQQCQDEIFPLATIILDCFLLINPVISRSRQHKDTREDLVADRQHQHHNQHQEDIQHLDHLPHSDHHNHNHHRRHNNHHDHHHNQHHPDYSLHHCYEQHESDDEESDNEHNRRDLDADSSQRELEQRQLMLFSACSLLLATKLRQTPRLYIQTLIEFSRLELPTELSREEMIAGELLMLSKLKWDLAALVTPNEFLHELLTRKCQSVLMNFLYDDDEQEFDSAKLESCDENDNGNSNGNNNNNNNSRPQIGATINTATNANALTHADSQPQMHYLGNQKQSELVNRVNRHTQTLLELCLMDSKLSQYSSSILAMSSMAVAINGLCKTKTSANFTLSEIVSQINASTNETNELELMIDVAFQIEKYVQTLLNSTSQTSTQANDDTSQSPSL